MKKILLLIVTVLEVWISSTFASCEPFMTNNEPMYHPASDYLGREVCFNNCWGIVWAVNIFADTGATVSNLTQQWNCIRFNYRTSWASMDRLNYGFSDGSSTYMYSTFHTIDNVNLSPWMTYFWLPPFWAPPISPPWPSIGGLTLTNVMGDNQKSNVDSFFGKVVSSVISLIYTYMMYVINFLTKPEVLSSIAVLTLLFLAWHIFYKKAGHKVV